MRNQKLLIKGYIYYQMALNLDCAKKSLPHLSNQLLYNVLISLTNTTTSPFAGFTKKKKVLLRVFFFSFLFFGQSLKVSHLEHQNMIQASSWTSQLAPENMKTLLQTSHIRKFQNTITITSFTPR